MTYEETEFRSSVLRQTIKSWRNEKYPSIRAIEAALGVFGYRLLPCPPLDGLPDHLRAQLEEIGQHFFSDDEVLAAAIHLATSKPQPPAGGPRYLKRDAPYWREAPA